MLGSRAAVEDASALPPEFEDVLVASINAPMDIDWTPDGRALVPTKNGQVWVMMADGTVLPTPAIDLSGVMCTNGWHTQHANECEPGHTHA